MNLPDLPVTSPVPAASPELPVAPSEWHDQSLVLELEALLDARKALMQELQVLDAQVESHFARLLPQSLPPALASGYLPQMMNGTCAAALHPAVVIPMSEAASA